jgi:G3E family GTPase
MIVDIVFGFLGSGKTTFITRILESWGSEEKIVVLVNEFGEVGIDGELLTAHGGDVVEMPSGCICCTLQADFRTQILDIDRTFQPDRVVIEPTGVATITQVQGILKAQLFESVIQGNHRILIADATGFMGLYKANRNFVESQVENAHIVLLNKCDLVDKRKAMLTRSAISAINPAITVLETEFGAVEWAEYNLALSTAVPDAERRIPVEGKAAETGEHSEPAHPSNASGGFHFHENEDALGYESFGLVFDRRLFDEEKLHRFFKNLNSPQFEGGQIVRAKGLFRLADNKWIALELASQEVSSQPIREFQKSKVSIIGKNLKREVIQNALEACAVDS